MSRNGWRLKRAAGQCAAAMVAWSFAAPASAQTAPQIRVVNYNIAQLVGSPIELRKVFQSLGEDPTPGSGVIRVPDVYVFQEVPPAMMGVINDYLDGSAPTGIEYLPATFTVNGGGGGENALFYRADSIVEDVSGHRDITNHTGPRATDRWQLHCVEDPSARFYIYDSHFKADTGPTNESQRSSEADAVRRDADALPAGALILFAGDWNIYSPSERAFTRFFDSGNGRAVDPRFAGVFSALSDTQSPHDGSNPDLIAGGMDDRFDFQLCSEELDDGIGFDVLADSYRTFGNDGQHYNLPINAGTDSYFSPGEQWKADALALASDHLPVVVDYVVPVSRFTLDVPALVGGLNATLGVDHAAPNQHVYFIYSLRGLGETPAPPLGVTLNLRSPVLLGQAQADGAGHASLRGRVPVGLIDRELWLQAAQSGSTSDVVLRLVQ